MKKLIVFILLSLSISSYSNSAYEISLNDLQDNYMQNYQKTASFFPDGDFDIFICKVAANSGDIIILTCDTNNFLYYYTVEGELLWQRKIDIAYDVENILISDDGSTILISQQSNKRITPDKIVLNKEGNIIFNGIIPEKIDKFSPDGEYLIPSELTITSQITEFEIYNKRGKKSKIYIGFLVHSGNLQFSFLNSRQLLLIADHSEILSYTENRGDFTKQWNSNLPFHKIQNIVSTQNRIVLQTDDDEFRLLDTTTGNVEKKFRSTYTNWFESSSKDIYFFDYKDNGIFGYIDIDDNYNIDENVISYDLFISSFSDVIKIDDNYIFNTYESSEFDTENESYKAKLLHNNQIFFLNEKFYFAGNNQNDFLITVGTDDNLMITIFKK